MEVLQKLILILVIEYNNNEIPVIVILMALNYYGGSIYESGLSVHNSESLSFSRLLLKDY